MVIVGSGFGGIGLAIALTRAGLRNFVILERASGLGGVWRDNTYPGAACDVPSPLYSYSFERRVAWPRRYAGQAAILNYLRQVAAKHGIEPHIRYDSDVTDAAFDEVTGRWTISTAAGEEHVADVFIPAVGQLSRPAWPSIPGMDRFEGHRFHSGRWDHGYALEGKRVAVIGTGASAIQFVPEIQPRVDRLTIFQRSAPYIVPRRDHGYDRWPHKIMRVLPWLQTADRFAFWNYAEFAQQALSRWKFLLPFFRFQFERHLTQQVSDPVLRGRLVPDYELGCKRVLFSNDYLPTLARPNVDVVTEPISEITESGVRTAAGSEHAVDAIIYGTGFATLDLLSPITITGLGGIRLADQWLRGARAYLGIAVPHFPNMFVLYGPNTNLGGGSIIHMLESQIAYVRQAVEHLAAIPAGFLTVREAAEQSWDDEVQTRLARSVWVGCRSWYRNADGRVVANWPGRTGEYRRRTRTFDPAAYHLHLPRAQQSVLPDRALDG